MAPAPNQLITDFEALNEHHPGDLKVAPLEKELVLDFVNPLDSLVDRAIHHIRASIGTEGGDP